jgi:hypothetical protein
MKRTSAIKVVLSCTGLAEKTKKRKKKTKKQKTIPILFFF